MLAEGELQAIEQLVHALREKPMETEERRWLTRCALLTREIRRLKRELNARTNDPGKAERGGDKSALM